MLFPLSSRSLSPGAAVAFVLELLLPLFLSLPFLLPSALSDLPSAEQSCYADCRDTFYELCSLLAWCTAAGGIARRTIIVNSNTNTPISTPSRKVEYTILTPTLQRLLSQTLTPTISKWNTSISGHLSLRHRHLSRKSANHHYHPYRVC